MTIGRTSAFIVTATVLAGSIPGVTAACYNRYSTYDNCGLSYTVRIIIGLSITFFLIAILSLIGYRRRRATQTNLVYLQRVPQAQPPSAPPQYPAETYNGSSPTTAVVQVRSITVSQSVASPPQGYA